MQPDTEFAETLIRDLPISREVSRIEFLDKGFSTDRKYLLWAEDEAAYLLRVSHISEYERRRSDYELTARVYEKGIPCPRPVACGQVRGYFEGDPPDDFWPLYNLYVAIVLPADIAWTHKHYPQYLDESVELIELITGTHDFINGAPPTWWQKQ